MIIIVYVLSVLCSLDRHIAATATAATTGASAGAGAGASAIATTMTSSITITREGSRTDSSLFSKQQSSGHEPSGQHVFCTADKDLTASSPPRTCLAFVRIGLF